jgi:hypothetical protein
MYDAVYSHNTAILQETVRDKSFDKFAREAYASPEGYAIRINPYNGEREMFVAGTRNPGDVASNLIELANAGLLDAPGVKEAYHSFAKAHELFPGSGHFTGFYSRATGWRRHAGNKYARIAADEQVSTIYGHSRGGAIVADMDTKATKVGLDSAVVISDNKDMINIRQDRWFDHLIGITGTNDEIWSHNKFHEVWH